MHEPEPIGLPAEFRRRQPYDDRGVLTVPIECCRCGYELRGLSVQGVCPECREPVARSAVGDLLEFMPADAIERLHRGLGRVVLGTYLSVLLPIVAAFGLGVIVASLAAPAGSTVPGWVGILGVAVLGLGLPVLAHGWWSLSANPSGEGPRDRAAFHACWTMSASYGAWITYNALGRSGPPVWMWGGGLTLADLAGFASLILWIGFSAAYMWNAHEYLRRVADRVPDPLLAHQSKRRKLGGVLWWAIGWMALFLGPLAAVSNLLVTLRACRFHTRRAMYAARTKPAASVAPASPDTLPESHPRSEPYAPHDTEPAAEDPGRAP